MTADDPRYFEWSNRKPSKRTKLQEKILNAPGEYVAERSRKVATTAATRAATTVARRVLPTLATGGAVAAGAATVASLAILAAGYVVSDAIARNQRVKLGDRLNAISNQFLNLQHQVMAKYGVRSWDQVPPEVRNRAVADYKRALGTATAQAQGSAIVGQRESYK